MRKALTHIYVHTVWRKKIKLKHMAKDNITKRGWHVRGMHHSCLTGSMCVTCDKHASTMTHKTTTYEEWHKKCTAEAHWEASSPASQTTIDME